MEGPELKSLQRKPMLLIVEDKYELLSLLEEVLTDSSRHILTASNYSEAKAILDREKVRVLLLDLHLPGKNGLDLLQYLTDKKYPILTVVLTGWYLSPPDLADLKNKVFEVLEKPVELNLLCSVIHDAFAASNI